MLGSVSGFPLFRNGSQYERFLKSKVALSVTFIGGSQLTLAYPCEESALKIAYQAIQVASKMWTMRGPASKSSIMSPS